MDHAEFIAKDRQTDRQIDRDRDRDKRECMYKL